MGNFNSVQIPDFMVPCAYGTLYASVRNKFNEFRPVFESLPLNERFSFLYNFALSEDLFCELQFEPAKSKLKALEFKKRGNEVFHQGKFLSALKLYTKSVAFAPPNSKELAVAFANRSAALLRLKRYEACLVDINRALKENHSEVTEAWKQKLLDRKKECVVNLKEFCATEMNRLVFLSSSTIDDDTLEDWIRHRMDECKFDENAMDMNYMHKFYLPSGNLTNPLIRNASVKFKVNYSPEWGRHIIATEDIKAGELLHIDKPYATILKFDYYYKHCAYCLVRCEALIPCPKCSRVMYCGVQCRQNAYNLYHRIECSILPIAMKFGEEESAWLSLRTLLIATKQGEELETILKHPAYQEPMKNTDSSDLKNLDSDFMHIYNLMFNYQRPEGKWHPSCINAVLVLYILKHSEFFAASAGKNTQINHETLTEVEAHVGNILFRLFSIMHCNVKLIMENYEKKKLSPGKEVWEMRNIAFGIYPFASFYNHSCDPNVFIVYHKDTVVCHATQPIDAGQQLCVDYGQFEHESPTLERLRSLQEEYYFTCNCEACENDWLPSGNFTGLIQSYQLINDIESVNVRRLYELGFAFNEWQRRRREKNAFSAKLLKLVCEYTSVFGKIAKKPCYDYFQCQREIRQIFCERGNTYLLARDKVPINL